LKYKKIEIMQMEYREKRNEKRQNTRKQWRTQDFFSGGVQQIQLRTERMGIWGR